MVGKGITSLSSRAKSTGPMRLMTMKAEETYDASGVHDGCSERADDGAYYGEDAENAKLVTCPYTLFCEIRAARLVTFWSALGQEACHQAVQTKICLTSACRYCATELKRILTLSHSLRNRLWRTGPDLIWGVCVVSWAPACQGNQSITSTLRTDKC